MTDKIIDIEVFRTGTHTDSNGDTQEWTQDDVDTIAKTYNERLKADPAVEAPIVKGHPETDDPALGWVKGLHVVGDTLKAKISLVKEFAKEVKDELYKKVSIALYPDMMLRHIGFLGAVQPAVKNLEPVKFAEGEHKTIDILFSDYALPQPKDTPETIDTVKTALNQRETLYGISKKDNIGYIQKPDAYKDLQDTDFADPVNYLYPVNDLPNFLASYRTWDNYGHHYNDVERQVILSKLYAKGLEYKINIVPDRLYSESVSFSITEKENLKRIKPATYADYKDMDFADPVHFRFPLKTKSDVLISMRTFSRKSIQTQYSEAEQQEIAAKIVLASDKHGIKRNFKIWKYADISLPIESLSKTQLQDYLTQLVTNNNIDNFVTSNEGIFSMNEEMFNAFIVAAVTWVTENVNPETASQFQAFVDEWKAANAATPPADEGTPPAGTPPPAGTQASESVPAQFAERQTELEKKIAFLEKKNRLMEFNEYLQGKPNLTPAIRAKVLPLMEVATIYDNKSSKMEFSEGDKPRQALAIEVIKEVVDLIPTSVEFGEFADGKKVEKKSEIEDWETVNVDPVI